MGKKPTTNQQPRLPWWVELFFVQIGLPDQLLRTLLKLKKSTQKCIKENNQNVFYTLLFLMAMIYINPIIKNSKLENACIKNTEIFIENSLNKGIKYKLPEVSIVAHNFCNGGSLE